MTYNINYIAFLREHFNRYGYVTWSTAARDMGCSRQNVFIHLEKALKNGNVTAEEVAKWRGSYLKAQKQSLKLSPENFEFLKELAKFEERSVHEVLNALLIRERLTRIGLSGGDP